MHKIAGIDPRKSGWHDRLPVSRLDETTLIHRMFGGYFRSQVRCTSCGYKSNTYDPFLDLALEVSKGSLNSISSAIADFTQKETLDARNQWKCGGCKKRVCATKQLTIFRPPLTLCIQLKRFTYGGSFSGYSFSCFGGSGKKICKPIQFPASLSLPLSDKRKCEYDLTGVIVHVGGSSNSGHYMAYVKKPGKDNSYQWYHMDDSYVSKVSEQTVLRQSDAYVLFYCRKEVKLEFPTPPARSNMSAAEASEVGKVRARARADSLASMSSQMSYQSTPKKIADPVKGANGADDNEKEDLNDDGSSRQETEPDSKVRGDDIKKETVANASRTTSSKIVLDRGPQIGKVEVVTGRHIKVKDAATLNRKFGSEIFEKRDDDTSDGADEMRKALLSEMEVQERTRKKKMVPASLAHDRLEGWSFLMSVMQRTFTTYWNRDNYSRIIIRHLRTNTALANPRVHLFHDCSRICGVRDHTRLFICLAKAIIATPKHR